MHQVTRDYRVGAEMADTKKKFMYIPHFNQGPSFCSCGNQTVGAFGPIALELFTDITKYIWMVTYIGGV